MEGYLGETVIKDLSETPYAYFTPIDWAMMFISRYGQADGDHHKAWVLDQIARILKGTPVIVKLAKWKNGEQEYRINLSEPSQEYNVWVEEMKCDDDGEEYGYETGIAP